MAVEVDKKNAQKSKIERLNVGKEIIEKKLAFVDLFLMAVGSTLGAAIFILLPVGMNMAGLGVILSILISGSITILVAMNYGELAAAMPLDGGGYTWIATAFGKDSSSFIVGWLVWLGNMGFLALSALGFSIYAGMIIDIASPIGLALISLFLFVIMNVITMKTSVMVEKVFTMGILLVFMVLWFYLGGSFEIDNLVFLSSQMEFVPIFTAASLLYVLFIGFEAVSTVSAEANKSSDLPKAFIYCVVAVMTVYIITSLMILGVALPGSSMNKTLLLDISGPLKIFVIFAGIFATLTSINAGLIAASRNLYALSRDEMMPRILGRISRDFKTPFVAVMVSGAISALLILTNAVEYVASIADFGYLIVVSMVCASVIFLRITNSRLRRPYKVPLYPWSSLLGMIFPLVLLTFLEEPAIYTGLLWILIGFFVYNFYKIVRSETRKRTKFYKFLRRFM